MIWFSSLRIGDKEVFVAVVIIVADSDRSTARRKHAQDVSVFSRVRSRMVANVDTGFDRNVFKAERLTGRTGTAHCGNWETCSQPYGDCDVKCYFPVSDHISLKSVSTRLL